MKTIIPVSLFALALCACNNAPDTEFKTDNAEYADSLVVDSMKSSVTLDVDYATSKMEATAVINNWITKQIGTPDEIKTKNMSRLVKEVGNAYMDSVKKDITAEQKEYENADNEFALPPAPQEYHFVVKPAYTTDKFVSYTATTNAYFGGAHGASMLTTAVFTLPEGNKLTYKDMFNESNLGDVRSLVIDSIKTQYFHIDTDSAFAEVVIDSPENLNLPQQVPYFLKDGVAFVYNEYEIAPYSAGMPRCVVSYDQLKPYFTESTLELLK